MDDSIAFDTNMLAKPTPRRLMTLWLEQANCRTLVLPRVYDELTAPSLAQREKRYKGRNIQAEEWDQAIQSPDSPYLLVEMSEDQKDAAAEFLMRFNLRCFPALNEVGEIARSPDAEIIAQGLACGADVVITNNMRSIDHFEVNAVATAHFGRNSGLLVTADNAILSAHPSGEASRHLLVTALASSWPDHLRPLDMEEAKSVLDGLCVRLASGVNMPDAAQRLFNAYDIDENLADVLRDAHALASKSTTLAIERQRAHRRRRVAQADATPPRRESG